MVRGDPFSGSGHQRFGGGLTGPVPRDLWILLGVVFFTFSLQFFQSTAWLPALFRLSPAVWRQGFIWQLVSYPFVGTGAPGLWFLLEVLILFLFGRDVFYRLGSRNFWKLLISASAVAGLVAVTIGILASVTVGLGAPSFPLLQGQRMLLVVLIAAFATLNRNATILLFFVLPVRARWFLLLEIVFAFLGFLGSKDLAGFLGICAAVGFTFGSLTGWRQGLGLRDLRLRLQHRWLRWRLAWLRRRRGIRVVKDDDPRSGPWMH